MWRAVIIPFANGIVQTIDLIHQASVKTAQVIYTYVLKPLGRSIAYLSKWTWRIVMIPLAKGIVQTVSLICQAGIKTAQAIYTYVLKPFGCALGSASVWVWNAMIIPICNGLLQACVSMKSSMVRLAQAINNYVIIPTSEWGASAFRAACNGSSRLIQAVGEAGCSVASAVREAFRWIAELFNFAPPEVVA